MSKRKTQLIQKNVDLVWLGAVFALFYWVFQAVRDTYMLNKGPLVQTIFSPDIMSFAMRLLVVTIILLFCIHVNYMQDRMQHEKENRKAASDLFALILSGIGFVMLYWILDSFQDIIIDSKGSLFERIVTPGTTLFVTRFFSVFVVIALIFITQYLIHSRRKTNEAIHKAQNQLIRTKEYLQKIVSHMKDGILVLDEQGSVLFMNPEAERLFGRPMNEMMGTRLNYEIESDTAKEMEIVNKDGKTITADLRSTSIVWEEAHALLVTLRDITEKRQVEQIRSNFLSLISVNMKTPIAGIMGSIQNMQEGLVGKLSVQQAEYLQVMYQSIRSKFDMINEMLTVINLESQGEKVRLEAVELGACLNKIIEKYKPCLQDKEVEIQVRNADSDILALADRHKLHYALDQIFQNAIKFTDKGRITIDLMPHENTIAIYLTDTGKGMDDASLKSLFTREKLIRDFPSAQKGLGFGLYIVKKYMEMQNGDIAALSTIGKGSQFKLTIPRYHA